MTLPRPSRRARLLGIALLVATVAAGMLAGAAFDHALAAREPAPQQEPGWHCHGPHGKTTSMILDQLELSAEQRARVDAVMARRRAQADAYWEREGPRMRGIVDSTRSEIRAILTPAQRAEYDRLRAQYRAARRAEREGQKSAPGRR
ncbi:MAG TPA: hypothetical protein VFQ76_05390 [Longimicrobiaceae bacterium]|nr:hypothetical protein [Longimicrobiaceae bacterium]